MSSRPKTAVHFGAGNIGRGLIGPLLSHSGYHVTFVDISEDLINALNTNKEYVVHILGQETIDEEESDFSGAITDSRNTLDALLNAQIMTTSVGQKVLEKISPIIALGVARRRKHKREDMTVIACENMRGASSALKKYIIDGLKNNEEDLAYLEEHVGFANCEVDRIVPKFKGHDALEVGVEGFYEWIVEKHGVKEGIAIKGMQLEENLQPFFERKLFTLNCGHAMLAYLGTVKGYSTIVESISDDEIKGIADAALHESGNGLVKRHGFNQAEHAEYIKKTMSRFENPNINDELARVSRQPLRKLSAGDRLVGPVNMCKEYDLPRQHLLKGIAAAFYFHEADDEEASELQNLIHEKGLAEAVEEVTEFKAGSEEHSTVLREYEELGRWQKQAST